MGKTENWIKSATVVTCEAGRGRRGVGAGPLARRPQFGPGPDERRMAQGPSSAAAVGDSAAGAGAHHEPRRAGLGLAREQKEDSKPAVLGRGRTGGRGQAQGGVGQPLAARLISQRRAAGLANWTCGWSHHARRAASNAASMPPCAAVGSCMPPQHGRGTGLWRQVCLRTRGHAEPCQPGTASGKAILRHEGLPAAINQTLWCVSAPRLGVHEH